MPTAGVEKLKQHQDGSSRIEVEKLVRALGISISSIETPILSVFRLDHYDVSSQLGLPVDL